MTMKGKHHSKETKRKISESKKGQYPSKESRKKMSEANSGEKNPFYGKHHTKENLKKISEATIFGINNSKDAKQKMSEAHKGKHLSEEHRRKDSESLRGEKNHFFGKKHSEETKRKMSEAKKGKKNPQDIHKKLILDQTNNLIKQGYRCIITDLKPKPDIIAFKDGKIYAYEIENGKHHQPDLNKYDKNKDYDEIYWCVTPDYKPWFYEAKNIDVIKINGCIKNE